MFVREDLLAGFTTEEILTCLTSCKTIEANLRCTNLQSKYLSFTILGPGATAKVVEAIRKSVEESWDFKIKVWENGIIIVHLLKREVARQVA